MHIYTKKVKDLTVNELETMNEARMREWGKSAKIDFKIEDKKGECTFVKDDGKIVAFGIMKPIHVELGNEKFTIMGIGRGMAIVKGKGYGSILNAYRIHKLRVSGKSGVAFTDRKNIKFFLKAGYKIKKHGIKKFAYKDPETGKLIYDNDGDMVYFEGKDRFITKLLKSKKKAITDTMFW